MKQFFRVAYCRLCNEMLSIADLVWSETMCEKCMDFDYDQWRKAAKLLDWHTEEHFG